MSGTGGRCYAFAVNDARMESLLAASPAVDRDFAAEHCARLGEDYFERFAPAEIAAHVRGLARVTPEHPVELRVRPAGGDLVECTVLAFDHDALFSLITGLLAAAGFGIERGDVFTWSRLTPDPARERRPRARRAAPPDAVPQRRRRRIVDQFVGRLAEPAILDAWAEDLHGALAEVLLRLEAGGREAAIEARHLVNERVTRRLAALKRADAAPVLYPVELAIDATAPGRTRLRIASQDTPAFLYALSTALALQQLSIERVAIRTTAGRIEDTIDVVDRAGAPLTDPARLDAVRLAILLTKQFTYFLDRAPDPYTALVRFERMVEDVARLPDGEAWIAMLSNPAGMEDLARLLGASDYLWEDFIRLQYESLLPVLRARLGGRRLTAPRSDVRARLEAALAGATTAAERMRRLNAFKDEECFRIDLDHILQPGDRFREMAESLTVLAEEVVRAAAGLVFADLAARRGRPRTVAGLEAPWAVFGLGKFGGAALGYASDIELLFVYGDHGRTDGPAPVQNREFFAELAIETARAIQAKREGIFRVDLRLRPHGRSGPPACSLESFCRYYGPGGGAHPAERLALVRLRAVAGDATLGARIERLRDEFVYEAPQAIRLGDLRDLRERQFRAKTEPGRANAKFSPGGLVDLEYAVQFLQVMHGAREPALRTPRIHAALDALREVGVLDAAERDRLTAAYDFLRRLINGLRMLRGSALDLVLPGAGSDEFAHLARRMGYARGGGLSPEQRLQVETETRTAQVRAFVERHFGRESLPGGTHGNVADLILQPDPPDAMAEAVLAPMGFQRAPVALRNLRALAGEGPRRDAFLPLAVLAADALKGEPDPDMALNNWERFVGRLPDAASHFARFLAQPRRLDLLLAIFSRSQFLADTLVRHPDMLAWVTDPDRLHAPRTREAMERELRDAADAAPDSDAWRRALRRFRRREVLRIGVRDLCLRHPLDGITADLSALAEAALQVGLERAAADLAREDGAGVDPRAALDAFALFAFGKLGGGELNYSSDVDLLGIRADDTPGSAGFYEALLRRLAADLSQATEDGMVFRIDYRLRPHGRASGLCIGASAAAAYYRDTAAPWELQAALKLRFVAGAEAAGAPLAAAVRERLTAPADSTLAIETIRRLRASAVRQSGGDDDVKAGEGGIRDIEFLVQGLQRVHAARHPEILEANTRAALRRLAEAGLIEAASAETLAADYAWLRRVEHYLQIMDDRQTHRLPPAGPERAALARRVCGRAAADGFETELAARRTRTRAAFLAFLDAPAAPARLPS